MPTQRPSVFITRRIPDAGLDILSEHVSLTIFEEDRQIARQEIIERIGDVDGMICLLSDPIDKEVIEAGKKLKVISAYAVGYNNIDIEAARNRGIVVTNTPGVLTDATADIAFALMIAAARRIAESDAWMRTHEFEGWAPKFFLGVDLVGKTLGIIGAGRIGAALAKRAYAGFDMKIAYHGRNRNPEFESKFNAQFMPLNDLLAASDFVSIHTPLTPETHHLIGEQELALMKPTAVLVNTARGPVVDEQALIRCLQEQRIFGVGLDVYEHEPAVPRELKELPNAVILPHIGSASFQTRDRMAGITANNCLAVLDGGSPEFRVA